MCSLVELKTRELKRHDEERAVPEIEIEDLEQLVQRPSRRKKGPEIRCPKCSWQPQRSDQWACTCLFAWNTFETGGRCPACQRQWHDTQCLECFEWSAHLDWYVLEDEDDRPEGDDPG
jgi:hypothetical protein